MVTRLEIRLGIGVGIEERCPQLSVAPMCGAGAVRTRRHRASNGRWGIWIYMPTSREVSSSVAPWRGKGCTMGWQQVFVRNFEDTIRLTGTKITFVILTISVMNYTLGKGQLGST